MNVLAYKAYFAPAIYILYILTACHSYVIEFQEVLKVYAILFNLQRTIASYLRRYMSVLQGSNNDLATPLKLCLQLGYHDLVGLILAHTADLRTDPDTVAWTNLDLPSAHPEWFYATFLPRYSAQGKCRT